MLKKIGRLIMLVAAGLFIGFAISTIILTCIPEFKELMPSFSMQALIQLFQKLGDVKVRAVFISFGWQVLYIIIGISALVVALKGRTGFWTTIAALAMLGVFIWQLITRIKADPSYLKNKDNILALLKDIANYAVYVAGIIVLKISRHLEKKEFKAYKKAKKAGKLKED